MKKERTNYDGKVFTHRQLWNVVEVEAKLANEREQGWLNHSLVAMVFAFHTIEAYLNFVGERIAPEIWKNERDFFRNEPYRGWDGKLRKVMELVELSLPPEARLHKTILDLKTIRDLIAHGKPERLKGETVHDQGTLSPFPVSTLHSLVTPKEKLITILSDVEQFLNQIHALATPKVKNDFWFGKEALREPSVYSIGSTDTCQISS